MEGPGDGNSLRPGRRRPFRGGPGGSGGPPYRGAPPPLAVPYLGDVHPPGPPGSGGVYTADERFTAYYDKEVPGCAAFLRRAVRAYIVNAVEKEP